MDYGCVDDVVAVFVVLLAVFCEVMAVLVS